MSVTDRSGTYDFLSIICSNYAPNLTRYLDGSQLQSRNVNTVFADPVDGVAPLPFKIL